MAVLILSHLSFVSDDGDALGEFRAALNNDYNATENFYDLSWLGRNEAMFESRAEPIEFIKPLSVRFPLIKIGLQWSSDEYGCNSGRVILQGGDVVLIERSPVSMPSDDMADKDWINWCEHSAMIWADEDWFDASCENGSGLENMPLRNHQWLIDWVKSVALESVS